MLCLKRPTDPAWLSHALAHLDEVLVDHAHCEHKAAVTALSFVSKYPDDPALVLSLSRLAAEEAGHLGLMVDVCQSRGLSLGHPKKDPYVQGLLEETRKDAVGSRVDRLLVSSLIEARSCERLKLLAGALENEELKALYDGLWRAEAGHYTLFFDLAARSLVRVGGLDAKAAGREARARLSELAEAEAELLARLPVRAAIH